MRIAHRFLVAFVLVVVVAGAVLGWTFDTHRADVEANAEGAVEDRAAFASQVLEDRITEQKRAVRIAATDAAIEDHGSDTQRQALEAFVEAAAFEGGSVVDETGELRAITSESGEEADSIGADLSDRAYVEAALEGEQAVSDPFVAETGNEVIVISAPIRNDTGDVVGTLNGAYHIDETQLFEPLYGDSQEAVTVESRGETVFSNADRFEETIDASEELEAADWTVTAHRDRAAMSAATDRLILFQLISGVTVLGVLTGFGYWIYSSTVRRIGRLHDRLRALERREYDGGPSIGNSGEWGRIDGAIDRLATTLDRREQMLLVLNRILRHNLRNTLNVVLGQSQRLETDLEGEHREIANEIGCSAIEILELADRARTTESLLDPVSEPPPRTDVAAMVRRRVDAFERRGESRLSVTVDAPETAIGICGTEIGTAIDELLENVAEHGGPDPTVEITVGCTDEHVRVSVADDGPGIPVGETSVITEDRSISQLEHLRGIGLWVTYWIVDRYDGSLRFETASNSAVDGDSGTTAVIELQRGQVDL